MIAPLSRLASLLCAAVPPGTAARIAGADTLHSATNHPKMCEGGVMPTDRPRVNVTSPVSVAQKEMSVNWTDTDSFLFTQKLRL